MVTKKPQSVAGKLSPEQIEYLKGQMKRLAERNASWDIAANDYSRLYEFLAVQKITYLYDDELFEGLTFVDGKLTGKKEELLDAYLIVTQGDEIQLKLFQFKFKESYEGGISTKELFAFVDRMNRVFLRGDLHEEKTLEAFKEVRQALAEVQKANKRAKTKIQCYYIVNGQNVSHTDESKIQEIRDIFAHDRQAYGFIFETYGGLDIYHLCSQGRVPIQEEVIELEYERGDGSILHHNIGPNPNGMPGQVLVGFVNVNQLTRLADRYSNNELFEKNVRLFLGTGKEVNRSIIDTVTSNRSAWFGFMNNGVSITAETVSVDMPPSKNRVKVRLSGMQIINGCQTVNALYHAKYAPELKDRFQGNSNVLVRIYQVEPGNTAFLNALIIATNSQNAIRPEDLLSNDKIQTTLQNVYRDYGVSYERKQGEELAGQLGLTRFSKEQAAMAYIGVVQGKTSRLRNSLSRREFFREGEEYYKVFNLRGEEGDAQPGPLPEDFEAKESANLRALQILAARCLEEQCRNAVNDIKDKHARGSLRKGAYYLAHIIYVRHTTQFLTMINSAGAEGRNAKTAKKLIDDVTKIGQASFPEAQEIFDGTLKAYLKKEGGNEDAALKNTKFADRVEEAAKAEG